MQNHATSTKRIGKIHFVHHLEKLYAAPNLGDWIASPYYYFTDFFSRYTCVLHSDWSVLWHEIERDDIVIFGGGGLLDNSDALNVVLNRLIDKCDNVIVWGAGTHKYTDNNIFNKKTAITPINYEKLALCGVRDYQHPTGLPFLPCASSLNPAFLTKQADVPIKRKIGTIKSALESTFAVSGLPSSVTNAEPIQVIVDYILSSEVILVSSYHGAFWSLLLGKKVILPATRLGVDKYKYFRYPVAFYDKDKYDEQELLALAATIPTPPDFLSESRMLNLEFFNKVRNLIEERIEKSVENSTVQILSKRVAQMEFTLVEMWNYVKKMNGRIEGVEGKKPQ